MINLMLLLLFLFMIGSMNCSHARTKILSFLLVTQVTKGITNSIGIPKAVYHVAKVSHMYKVHNNQQSYRSYKTRKLICIVVQTIEKPIHHISGFK